MSLRFLLFGGVEAERPEGEDAAVIFVINQGGFIEDADHRFAWPIAIVLLLLEEEACGTMGSFRASEAAFTEGKERPRCLGGLSVGVVDVTAFEAALVVFAPRAIGALVDLKEAASSLDGGIFGRYARSA